MCQCPKNPTLQGDGGLQEAQGGHLNPVSFVSLSLPPEQGPSLRQKGSVSLTQIEVSAQGSSEKVAAWFQLSKSRGKLGITVGKNSACSVKKQEEQR